MANLLESASVVLTPTAYNNGKALCIKPDDGSGDFDFSRNSAATRVNAQGLIEDVQILSSNLVQNGDFSQQGSQLITNGNFATDSNWNLISGVTYNAGGYLDFDGSQGNGSVTNTPNTTFTLNKTYKVVYEIKNYTSGTIKFRFQGGSNTIGQQQSGDGVKTEYIVCNDSSNNNFNFFGSSSFIGSIDNVSVKEVGQNWSLTGTAEISNGAASFPNNSASYLIQSSIIDLSVKQYKLQYEIVSTNGFNCRIAGGNSAFGTFNLDSLTVGVKTAYLTSNGTKGNLQINNNAFIGSVTNISIIEITDDTNLPRISYEGFSFDGSGDIIPDSGCGSWLWENQSTNLIPYSENFNTWNNLGSRSIITLNSIISPDGTLNGTKQTQNAVSNSVRLRFSSILTIGTEYTFSVFAKKGNYDKLQMNISGVTTNFTLTDNWARYEITVTAPNNTFVDVGIPSGSIGDFIYLWGAQAEEQSYATSYIPTSGTQKTRNQDVCNNGGSVATINSAEGVLYFEAGVLVNDGTNRTISINDVSSSNRVSIILGTANNEIRGQVLSSGTTSFDFSTTAYNFLNSNKIAIKYKVNDFALWVNGVEIATDTSGNTPTNLNRISFDVGNTGLKFFGKTKAVAVWKEALTDTELQELTTI